MVKTVKDQLGRIVEADGVLKAPAVILVTPQLGENIGAACRCMLNFGLTDLRLVAPRDGWPNSAAEPMAAGAMTVVHLLRRAADENLSVQEGEVGKNICGQKSLLPPACLWR